MPAESQEPELVRWRPWPCENCRGGAPLIDYLLGRHEAGGEIPGGSEDEVIEEMIARERAWVVEWAESCEHTAERSEGLARLDEGSEHIVYLAPSGKAVVKLTKPGLYGDAYYLVDGRVHQRCCTPGDYMIRISMLDLTFGFAPTPVGITKAGQIVTVQRFVEGEPPTLDEVEEFLLRERFEPVKRSCWLWKRKDPNNEVEYWIGDAREDNFVKTPHGIVPIDLRMWGVPAEAPSPFQTEES